MKYTLIILLITLITTTSTLFAKDETICGRFDDRKPSSNPKVARILQEPTSSSGCTMTMISPSCAITAGHCKKYFLHAEFNTPASIDNRIQHPGPENIYVVDQTSIQYISKGYQDWAVGRVLPNIITGKLAGDLQGFYKVSFNKPQSSEFIKITGYGADRNDPSRNFAQQSHSGEIISKDETRSVFKYSVDTMGGNSGSSVILQSTNEIIGIHTRGGCNSRGGSNLGTLIFKNIKLINAIKACLDSEK